MEGAVFSGKLCAQAIAGARACVSMCACQPGMRSCGLPGTVRGPTHSHMHPAPPYLNARAEDWNTSSVLPSQLPAKEPAMA